MLYALKNSKSDYYPKHQFTEEPVNAFVKCPCCKVGPGSSWDIQSFGVQAGSRWPDFLPIGNFIAVSDLVIDALSNSNIKGYEIGSDISIRMYGKKYKSNPIRYRCIIVKYGLVACSNEASGNYYCNSEYTRKAVTEIDKLCRYCSYVDDGRPSVLEIDKLNLDYSTWDGSDIGMCCSFTLVSERLARLIIGQKFTNVGVYNIADAREWDACPLGLRDLA